CARACSGIYCFAYDAFHFW
nr:immunoglobulin heavy chain junction region [Macaca mulatta]